jgi:hypothetical protein
LLPQTSASNASWGISTGIPLPKGALHDTTDLVLYENGQRIPAQFTTRATWDIDGDIKWIGLDFVGKYDGTTPRSYQLSRRPGVPPTTSGITVTENAASITVDNKVIKFKVSKMAFAGIEAAWFDANGDGLYSDPGEKLINGQGGPFLIDNTGNLYMARLETAPLVVVEEQGPVRVTIKASGWYRSSATKLCQFVTRITAVAGQPLVRVSQRTILTHSTSSTVQIKDAGWQFATANHPNSASGIVADDEIARELHPGIHELPGTHW